MINETELNTELSMMNQDTTSIDKNDLLFEYGDIVELVAPNNNEYHETTNFIHYIDEYKMALTNVSSLRESVLNFDTNGYLNEESIIDINLLSRASERGYARQNKLLPNTWIDIHFGGEVPQIITGQISNLEEDMIEINTYPDLITIYIDFKYQGLPLDIHIDKIVIREKPSSMKSNLSLASLKEGETPEDDEEDLSSVYYDEQDEFSINIPEDAKSEPNIKNVLKEMYTDANTITFGEKLEDIPQLVEVPESQKKYSLDAQVSDMMDEMLSTIPNSKRTKRVLNNIHTLIERYVHLREKFSNFNDNNEIMDRKVFGEFYKPLVEKLFHLNQNLLWIMPIVMNRRKINVDPEKIGGEFFDIVSEDMTESFSSVLDLKERFYKKGSNDQTVSYDLIQNREKDIHRPFDKAFDANKCVTTKEVDNNIEAVVDNLSNFYSSVFQNSVVAKKRFLIQKYNLGEKKLVETKTVTNKKKISFEKQTDNDEICIKSFLTLPSSVIKFSEIKLNNSSILTKSMLHQNYLSLFRLLNNKAKPNELMIEDFSKMLDYDVMEQSTEKKLFDDMNEFVINSDEFENLENYDNDEKYRKLLEVIIPYSRNLIKMYQKHITNSMTLVQVVKKLEPFAIEMDTIEYGQYMEIRYFIKTKIAELKKKISEKYSDFNVLKTATLNNELNTNTILRILSENGGDFSDAFFKHYKFLETEKLNTKQSASEILHKMTIVDNNKLYTDMISSILISLNSVDGILNTMQGSIDDMNDEVKIKSEECGTKYLSNKYSSLSELQKDNEKEDLYFDTDLDDTPYEIMKKYEKEQKEMPTDLFFTFLVENLTSRHGVAIEDANEFAETLIAKKKKVKDNHYAIVEILPKVDKDINVDSLSQNEKESIENEADIRKKVYYYRRLKDNWIKDEDINENSFFDNNTLFCNLSSRNCLKNENTKICESNDQIKIRIKHENREALKKEFDNRYQITIEELEKKLNNTISIHLKNMRKLEALKEIDLYRANNLHYEISKTVRKEDIIESPYKYLFELIMGQDDFSKKQNDICKFVEKFCRESNIENLDEDKNWYYCKDTNTKLVPLSLFTLAQCYITGKDYQIELEKVCNEVGTLSDDGDAIVDKHSGFVLKKKDLSTEEGFDEIGRKITSREIIEKEIGETLQENKNIRKIFETELSESIYNISKSICNNIDIPIDAIDDKVLRFSNLIIEKSLLSEYAYKRRSEANFNKTGKYLGHYDKYKNETILTIIGSVLFICVQTVIPSFKTKKTFPSCVRSFSGYPMTGIEDLTGINYIACVLIKMKSSVQPWDSLKTMKQEKMANRMKEVIDNFIIKYDEIKDLYLQKKEYILLNPNLVPPEELKLETWVHCLPPLSKVKILSSLKNVSSEFKKDLMDKIKKGDPRQNDLINVVKSKQIQNGYGVIEIINSIVKNKDSLLKTASGLPFLENACCSESKLLLNPIMYFSKEDQNLKVILQRSSKNNKLMKDFYKLSDARMINYTENTFIKYPELSSDYLEENIYHAFISHCNIDKNLPIPNNLKNICTQFPDGYDIKASLEEKVEFLKRNGKRFTVGQLQQLMCAVRKENKIGVYEKKKINNLDGIKDLISSFENKNSELFEENIRKYLVALLNSYEPKKMTDKSSEQLDELTNYLSFANHNLYKQIMDFFDKHGNQISSRKFNKIAKFLLDINNWDLEKDVEIHEVGKYIENAIHNMCKLYPTLIVNNADFYKYICKHWIFSDNHKKDISSFVEKYAKIIEKFKGDQVLENLLKSVNINLIDMCLFIQHLPKQSELVNQVKVDDETSVDVTFHGLFDKSTYFDLIKYCFFRTIYEFIQASYDTDLLRSEVKMIKDKAIEKNDRYKNDSDLIGSKNKSINENYEETMNDLESEIITDEPDELKSRVCSLLEAFLDVEMENKQIINYSYENIMKKVNRSKEREKKSIIDYLGNMSKEERKVEELFKNYKLGRWNVGLQKGLVHYDQNTYERERSELLSQLFEDENAGNYEVVSEMRREIFEIENDENKETEEFYDQEANDISQLDEDYTDGIHYEEDREDGF